MLYVVFEVCRVLISILVELELSVQFKYLVQQRLLDLHRHDEIFRVVDSKDLVISTALTTGTRSISVRPSINGTALIVGRTPLLLKQWTLWNSRDVE